MPTHPNDLPPSENRIRRSLLLLFGVAFAGFFFGFGHWRVELNGGDPFGYYINLPAYLIYQDVGDYRKTLAAANVHFPGLPDHVEQAIDPAPDGKRHIKWPLGVAILTLPFFLAAQLFCLAGGTYPADGFSTPYLLMASLAPLFYVLAGLWLLFGVLRRHFSLPATVLTLATLALATNLFYFAAYHNFMAHGFLFTLVAWVLDRTQRFWDNPSVANAAWVGAATGLVGLTRQHDLTVALIPVLWGVYSAQSWRDRRHFFVKKGHLLLVAAAVGLLCLLPQAIYYKTVSGHWWWYAYGEEKFDFRHPHIWGGWFDYKNGWLIYTPVMALSLLGIFWLRRFAREALVPLLTVLPIHMVIAYSWWCWYYINGFGSRPMIDLYALLAFPLAAFFQISWRFRWAKLLLAASLLFFTWLNIFQIWQFERGVLWSQFETKAHFWTVFGKTRHSLAALTALESNEKQPSGDIVFVRRLLENGVEDSTGTQFRREPRHGGNFAVQMADQEFGATSMTEAGAMQDAKPGDWIRVSIWGFAPGATKQHDQFALAILVVSLQDAAGQMLHYSQVRIANKIGNPEGSMWTAGEADRWGEAALFMRIPANFPPDGKIRTYVWNPSREQIFIDDLSIELWRAP